MLGKPENPVCPLSYNKPYQKKSSMIQKLSASIFLCLWGIVSVYGNLHPVIDKDPLSIAVEAFDNQTHPTHIVKNASERKFKTAMSVGPPT